MKSKNRNLLIIAYDRDHSNNDLKKPDFISRTVDSFSLNIHFLLPPYGPH